MSAPRRRRELGMAARTLEFLRKSLGGHGDFIWVCSTLFVLNCGCVLQRLANEQLNEVQTRVCTYTYINAHKLGLNCSGSAGFTLASPRCKRWHFGPLRNL